MMRFIILFVGIMGMMVQAKYMPLFEAYPMLAQTITHIQLANLPTPIIECTSLAQRLGHQHIYMKLESATAAHKYCYGGNKVRKLEFLLADAMEKKAKKIVTLGSWGTNHGLATACYAKQLGLDCLLMLKPQPNSPVVQQNLLLDYYFGAQIELFANSQARAIALDALLAHKTGYYFIPTGGSVALGALGYVNAAFELKNQILSGFMPEPHYIYLPVGSCGTAAGLLLGLQLAQLNAKIVAVAVEPEESCDQFYQVTKNLFEQTNRLLNHHTAEIPCIPFPDHQLIINKEYCGTQYGLLMPEVTQAIELMQQMQGVRLEGTYSGKACAAIIADIANGVRDKQDVILFIDTYDGSDFSHLTSNINYKDLDSGVHHLFNVDDK